MKQQKTVLGLFLVVGSMIMGVLLSTLIRPSNVVYAGTTAKAVPAECLGPNGQMPAEYSVSGEYVAGSGADFGTVSVKQSGSIIEVDFAPNPPFTVPTVACVETVAEEVIDWHPASRPDSTNESSGVTIDTAGDGYPVSKQSADNSSTTATTTVETVWMVWGAAPYSIYIPITTD